MIQTGLDEIQARPHDFNAGEDLGTWYLRASLYGRRTIAMVIVNPNLFVSFK